MTFTIMIMIITMTMINIISRGFWWQLLWWWMSFTWTLSLSLWIRNRIKIGNHEQYHCDSPSIHLSIGSDGSRCPDLWFEYKGWFDVHEKNRKQVKQMQPMRLCNVPGRRFEETFENTQWGKTKQMQPVWFCIQAGSPSEDTFEKAQWRKDEQMQPMWFWIISGRQFEDTFENTQWRKAKQMQPMWLCIILC